RGYSGTPIAPVRAGAKSFFAAIAPSVARRTRSSCHGGAVAFTHIAWLLLLLVATVVSDAAAAQLTASWTDNSAGLAAFEITRRAENEFDFSSIATVPAGSQSYVDSGVLEGVTYCYRVRAYTDAGQSADSDQACASVPVAAVVHQPAFMLWVTKAGSG